VPGGRSLGTRSGRSNASHPRYTGPVIDAHCHYDASTRAYASSTNDTGGIDAAVNLWDLVWPPNTFEHELEAWSSLRTDLVRCHVPDLTEVGAPGYEERIESGLRNAAVAGAAGVKVWKPLGLWLNDVGGRRLAIDDARLGVLWSVAGELGLPIMIHVGDPPAFFAPLTEDNPRIDELRAHPDWWWGGGDYASLEQIHEELEAVVCAFPGTVFVGVHFGCFMSWDEVDRMLAEHPNYHVDTAAAVADLGRGGDPLVRDIFLRRPDRILFGTDLIRVSGFDMPESEPRWDLGEFFSRHWAFFETAGSDLAHPLPAQGPWSVHGLDLPENVLAQVYWANAARLFGLD
jgi:hypothetical protein